MTDFLKTYKPENAAALTTEQVQEMRSLTIDQIKALAKEYPNRIYNRAYLLILDSKSKLAPDKQLPTLSTWENLYNLITKNGLKYVAIGFRGQGQVKQRTVNVRPRKSEVIDLSDAELMSLPGFVLAKKNGETEVIPTETVPVKKVNKGGRPKKIKTE